MDDSLKWLLFEGLLPLVGTAILYWLLAMCFLMAQSKAFTFRWHEPIDALGWLYGAAVLAIQVGSKGWGQTVTGLIPFFCWGIAAACCLILITAIFSKAADNSWQPQRAMKVGATVICGLVLYAGYQTQVLLCCANGGHQ